MKKILKISIIITVAFLSCKKSYKEKNIEIIKFNESSFENKKYINGSIDKINLPCNPIYFYLYRDSILIINNIKPDLYYITLYNLKKQQKIKEIARRGKGPNEYLSSYLICDDENHNYFIVQDIHKNEVSIFYLDSVLKKDNYIPERVKVPYYTRTVAILDSNYLVGYNGYYLMNEKYKNNVNCLFLINRKNKAKNKNEDIPFKYFTINATGGKILVSERKDLIWVVHYYFPRIDLYNKKLQKIKSFYGPKSEEPIYEIYNRGDYQEIYFAKGLEYQVYNEAQIKGDSIFIGYIAVYNKPIIKNLSVYNNSIILLLNATGKFIYKYYLDHNARFFTIDKTGKKLYGQQELDHCPEEIITYDF